MNIGEYKETLLRKKAPNYLFINELISRRERTLLYGYDRERNTWHIYFKHGKIHEYLYKLKEDISYNTFPVRINLDTDYIIPDKRLYPECCDFDFCRLLITKGANLTFTTFNEDREYRDFYGKTW